MMDMIEEERLEKAPEINASQGTPLLAHRESIRESIEEQEHHFLHPFAVRSSESRGRLNTEVPCPLRTCFQRDKDRILHSKAFRRLIHKTQVFISPTGDHYRTRLTHTLEVAQVSRTIARALRLNEDLTEAIALGHDLGHPPFGHNGEEIINEFKPFCRFNHEHQSVRIASLIEPMNLSAEVLEGMSQQMNTEAPNTLEAQVVKIADRMTYLHHDVEDAVRAKLMKETEISQDICQVLGETRKIRLDTMVIDLVQATQQNLDSGEARVSMTRTVQEAMNQLRKWMFKHVYLSPSQLDQKKKVRRVLSDLYLFYSQHPQCISENIPIDFKEPDAEARRVVDYIAGMTDRYAIAMFNKHLLPNAYGDSPSDSLTFDSSSFESSRETA